MRNLDELEPREMHARFEILVPVPFAIRLAHDDRALHEQAFDDEFDVQRGIARLAHAERDVFEITEKREILRVSQSAHAGWPCSRGRVRECFTQAIAGPRRFSPDSEASAPMGMNDKTECRLYTV